MMNIKYLSILSVALMICSCSSEQHSDISRNIREFYDSDMRISMGKNKIKLPHYDILYSKSDFPYTESKFSNFLPSDNDVAGIVVYEGTDDFIIIETRKGYAIAEIYNGWLNQGDVIYGKLNSYGMKWILRKGVKRETKIYIAEYGLAAAVAIEKLIDGTFSRNNDYDAYDYNHHY